MAGTPTPPALAPARAWRVVLEKIETDLLDGTLKPGDRLAPERELAATLGVGRSSVREALRVLEVMGLIRTGTGSGPTSGAIIIATPQGGMSALLRLQVAAQGFPFDDVVATRLVLESAVVDALAADPTRSTVQAREVLVAMDADDLTAPEFLALDAQLHLALAEASGNLVIAAMMAGLRTAIESYVQAGAAGIAQWDAAAERLRHEHHAILDAVDVGDPALARTLVHDHIVGYYAAAGLARSTAARTQI
ncbi:FCD domain-containing protein [Microbacterium sp. PRC9]|uniref:FadR/GntR family transcriptional regulator n=1 Tax=Microbacterium sp. PRC9 TaxID=2962591 RepID=UPI0028828770|nr:FCD domain-containing protein [Microbacterium sp. PRC9]MDT0141809.1 GntR family transcriptional regulator [Microbacterium sp. PRC9]